MRAPPAAASLKGRALRALAAREYTRADLVGKLKVHEEHAGQLVLILDELQAKGFINDQRAAESLVHRRSVKWGAGRVLQELRAKGLDAETVQQAVSLLKGTELDRAKDVWRRKFGEAAKDTAERMKQMRFLAGRGFAPDVIRRVVRGDVDDDVV